MNNNSTTRPGNTGPSKKRIPYLDLLKGSAIVCVFWGHSVIRRYSCSERAVTQACSF